MTMLVTKLAMLVRLTGMAVLFVELPEVIVAGPNSSELTCQLCFYLHVELHTEIFQTHQKHTIGPA